MVAFTHAQGRAMHRGATRAVHEVRRGGDALLSVAFFIAALETRR
jgi:hypothetical protein